MSPAGAATSLAAIGPDAWLLLEIGQSVADRLAMAKREGVN